MLACISVIRDVLTVIIELRCVRKSRSSCMEWVELEKGSTWTISSQSWKIDLISEVLPTPEIHVKQSAKASRL